MQNERLNLPSASSFDRVMACPGSKALIDSLPPDAIRSKDDDEDAQRGQRIHRAWELSDPSGLSEDELADYSAALKLANLVEEDWRKINGVTGPVKEYREERLWLNDDKTLLPVASGQFDSLKIWNRHGLDTDLKSGWTKNLTPAEQNYQLRLHAVLMHENHGVTKATLAFIKPKSSRIDVVEYGLEDLQRSRAMIDQGLWEADQPNAPRRPGSWCRYCVAKGWCAEAAAYAMLPAAIAPNPVAAVRLLTTREKLAIQEKASLIRKVLDEVNAQLKMVPENELADHGWRITEGRKTEEVKDVATAFTILTTEVFKDIPMDDWTLWTGLKIHRENMAEAVAKIKGCSKREAKAIVADTIRPYCETKLSEGSLERI